MITGYELGGFAAAVTLAVAGSWQPTAVGVVNRERRTRFPTRSQKPLQTPGPRSRSVNQLIELVHHHAGEQLGIKVRRFLGHHAAAEAGIGHLLHARRLEQEGDLRRALAYLCDAASMPRI